MLTNYKELRVRQKMHQLCLEIYGVTKVSVPSNIAEGYGRKTTRGYVQFLHVGYGLNWELETQILLSGDMGYLDAVRLKELEDSDKRS